VRALSTRYQAESTCYQAGAIKLVLSSWWYQVGGIKLVVSSWLPSTSVLMVNVIANNHTSRRYRLLYERTPT
jgi:hypothetical protein